MKSLGCPNCKKIKTLEKWKKENNISALTEDITILLLDIRIYICPNCYSPILGGHIKMFNKINGDFDYDILDSYYVYYPEERGKR